MAMPKGGSESGAGALREWRTAQGDKQLYKNVVMGTMLVTQTIQQVYNTILVAWHIRKNIFIITTVYPVLFRIEAP